MASQVTIANDALSALGQERIMAFDENNDRARLATEHYPGSRDHVLESMEMKGTITRASLPLLTSTPLFGFANQFQLPADFIKLKDPELLSERFRIEGDKYLTDSDIANVEYIRRETDVNLFGELVRNAIGFKLAEKMCLPLTKDRQLRRDIKALYEDALAEAQLQDMRQGPIDQLGSSDWLQGREGVEPIADKIEPGRDPNIPV